MLSRVHPCTHAHWYAEPPEPGFVSPVPANHCRPVCHHIRSGAPLPGYALTLLCLHCQSQCQSAGTASPEEPSWGRWPMKCPSYHAVHSDHPHRAIPRSSSYISSLLWEVMSASGALGTKQALALIRSPQDTGCGWGRSLPTVTVGHRHQHPSFWNNQDHTRHSPSTLLCKALNPTPKWLPALPLHSLKHSPPPSFLWLTQ